MDKKELTISMMVVLVVIAVLSLVIFVHPKATVTDQTTPAVGGGFSHSFCDTNGNSGTTTPLTYQFSAAASTTIPCFTDQADQVDTQLYVVASSTASTVNFTVQYSNDNITWYNLETPLAVPLATNGYIAFATTTNSYTWTPGTTATSTIDFPITAVNSKYTRVRVGMSGAGFGFYGALINKNVSRN